MRKTILMLMVFSVSFLYSSNWKTGWAQGTSTYSLVNGKNEQLLLECSDYSKNIYIYSSKGSEVSLEKKFNYVINNSKGMTNKEILEDDNIEEKTIWSFFINKLASSKDIIIKTDKKVFKFKANNSNQIADIKDSCSSIVKNKSIDMFSNLENSLNGFSNCSINNDYKCQAKYLDKSLIDTMGGIEAYANIMRETSSQFKILDIVFNKPFSISKNNGVLYSKIVYNQIVKMPNQQTMDMQAILNAVSNDSGKTWTFIQEH